MDTSQRRLLEELAETLPAAKTPEDEDQEIVQ
jgi:hypothetical protein